MSSLYESLAQQVNSLHAPQSEAPSEYIAASQCSHPFESGRMVPSVPYHNQQAINLMSLQSAAPQLSSHWTRYSISEFAGTFIATIIMDYTFYTLSHEMKEEEKSLSGFLFLSLGMGSAYFLGTLIAVETNLNAMFTFALALCRLTPWKLVPIIILSQWIGSTSAHLLFYFMIGSPEPLDDAVAFCFGVNPPSDEITNGRILMSSIVFITILLMALLPVLTPDPNRTHCISSMLFGLIISAVEIPAFSAGAQMNPTRFFSAFMAMAILGFDKEHFTVHTHYWWTAFIGPFVGVIVTLAIQAVLNVAQWNEPRDWKVAMQKVVAPTDSP